MFHCTNFIHLNSLLVTFHWAYIVIVYTCFPATELPTWALVKNPLSSCSLLTTQNCELNSNEKSGGGLC
jgi:hypothetical protein